MSPSYSVWPCFAPLHHPQSWHVPLACKLSTRIAPSCSTSHDTPPHFRGRTHCRMAPLSTWHRCRLAGNLANNLERPGVKQSDSLSGIERGATSADYASRQCRWRRGSSARTGCKLCSERNRTMIRCISLWQCRCSVAHVSDLSAPHRARCYSSYYCTVQTDRTVCRRAPWS